jgi:soluble lytic murein transglycosylase
MSDRTAAERKAAKAIIDQKAAAFDYSARQRLASTQAGVWNQVLAGKTLDEIQQSREFKILDGTTKIQLMSQIDTFNKKGGDDAGQLAYYLTLTEDPAKLAGMTDAEIVAEAPKLGNALTKDLLKRRQSLNDPNNVQAASIDEDTFKALAQEAGLDPFKPKKSEKEAAALGRLKYTIEQKIDIEQQAKKRKLTPQEKEAIFRQEIDNKVFVDRSFRTDPQMPISLVETDKLGDTYVVVNGQEVRLNSIPATSRNMIIRQLRAAGRPITEQAIAEVYVLSRNLPSSAAEQIPQ